MSFSSLPFLATLAFGLFQNLLCAFSISVFHWKTLFWTTSFSVTPVSCRPCGVKILASTWTHPEVHLHLYWEGVIREDGPLDCIGVLIATLRFYVYPPPGLVVPWLVRDPLGL